MKRQKVAIDYGTSQVRILLSGRASRIVIIQTESFGFPKTLLGREDRDLAIGRNRELVAVVRDRIKESIETYDASETWSRLVDLDDVVVTVPTGFSGTAKGQLMEAFSAEGMTIRYTLSEPLAAFWGFQSKVDGQRWEHFKLPEPPSSKTVLVVDWGAGTLDCTLLVAHNRHVNEVGMYGSASDSVLGSMGGIAITKAISDVLEAKARNTFTKNFKRQERPTQVARNVWQLLAKIWRFILLTLAPHNVDSSEFDDPRLLSESELNAQFDNFKIDWNAKAEEIKREFNSGFNAVPVSSNVPELKDLKLTLHELRECYEPFLREAEENIVKLLNDAEVLKGNDLENAQVHAVLLVGGVAKEKRILEFARGIGVNTHLQTTVLHPEKIKDLDGRYDISLSAGQLMTVIGALNVADMESDGRSH